MSLQDDWLKYMENPEVFPDDHFAPPITDTEEPVDLETAFAGLPNGRELIKRINRIRQETAFTGLYHVPEPEEWLDREKLKVLAKRYADSVADRLRGIGETEQAARILHNPIEFISESDFMKKEATRELRFLNAAMDLSRDFNKWKDNRPSCYKGLKEAVLFMTKIPEVTRYILSAIVKYPVDDEAYYELWRGGAGIEFCEDKTLVILPDVYED